MGPFVCITLSFKLQPASAFHLTQVTLAAVEFPDTLGRRQRAALQRALAPTVAGGVNGAAAAGAAPMVVEGEEVGSLASIACNRAAKCRTCEGLSWLPELLYVEELAKCLWAVLRAQSRNLQCLQRLHPVARAHHVTPLVGVHRLHSDRLEPLPAPL